MRIGAAQTPSPWRGEGWGEGALRSGLFGAVPRHQKFLVDRFENAVGVGKHIAVPEAQYPIAVFLDNRGASSVAHGIMLPPVQLDCQPWSAAREVGDIGVDLQLADELLAFEVAAAEVGPEPLFGVGLIDAEFARDRSQALPSQLSTPSPNPLPAGERVYCGAPVNA